MNGVPGAARKHSGETKRIDSRSHYRYAHLHVLLYRSDSLMAPTSWCAIHMVAGIGRIAWCGGLPPHIRLSVLAVAAQSLKVTSTVRWLLAMSLALHSLQNLVVKGAASCKACEKNSSFLKVVS